MTIHIEDLTFDTIIGLLDFERDKPQRIIINLTANYDYRDNNFVDYADMVTLIQKKLKKERYELLENALLGLKELLFATYPQLNSLEIKLTKPDILSECSVALSKKWDFK